MPFVSVIMPVYRAEAYLHRCVDSFIAQTFKDFELLLIDDGSPDGSGNICDDYASKDGRIKVFHKENGGVSSARQYGLDNASGKYIIQADPDDWVEPDMLESLYFKALESDADMIICDFLIHYSDYEVYSKQQPSHLDYISVRKDLLLRLHGSCCNKLIKREKCLEYDIKFHPVLSYSEDLYFNLYLLLHPITVAYLNRAFYHYDKSINLNSISGKYSISDFKYDVDVISVFDELLADTDIFELAHHTRSMYVVRRSFYGNIFSSAEFKSNCMPFSESVKYYILNNDGLTVKDRLFTWLMYYSCKGYYTLSYSIYSCLIKTGKLRRWIRRRF